MTKSKLNVYALYKGDKFIDMGTAQELADKIKIRKDSLLFYLSPTYKKRGEKVRQDKDRYILIKVDDISEDGN